MWIDFFKGLSLLPNELKTNHVKEARDNHMDENITSALAPQPYGTYKTATGARGLFQEFEYVPSPYNLADDLAAMERMVRGGSSGE
jgi:hypothetical protein